MKRMNLLLLVLLASCTTPIETIKEPPPVLKAAIHKQEVAEVVEQCVQGIKQVETDCKKSVDQVSTHCKKLLRWVRAETIKQADGHKKSFSPTTKALQVLKYRVNPPKCGCASPADVRYDNPLCKHPYCEGGVYTKMKVKNGGSVTQYRKEIHVECVYYDMADTEIYLVREQEFFKPTKGTTHTVHEFTAPLPFYIMQLLKKDTVIGAKCSVVRHPRPPVDAQAKMPRRGAKKPWKATP